MLTGNQFAALIRSTGSAVILLDADLRVLWFADAAAGFLPLESTAIGQSLADLPDGFGDELQADAQQVFDELMPIEQEVETDDGSWHLRRVLPYRTADDRIDGVVITFTDVTLLKDVQQQLEELNEELEHRVEERTGAIRLLYDVAAASNERDTVDQAVTYVLQRVCDYNGWDFGYILFPDEENPDELIVADMRYELEEGRFSEFWKAAVGTRLSKGNSLPGQVYEMAKAAWISDVDDDWVERELQIDTVIDIGTAVAFPVMVEKRVVAVMEFFADDVFEPEEDLLEAMQAVGTQLGRIIERKSLEKQAAVATIQEQRRIGRELHDTVLQHLAGSSLLMESLVQDLQDEGSSQVAEAARINDLLHEMQDQLRAISRGLVPVEVDAGGLMAALNQLAKRTSDRHEVATEFQCDTPVAIDDDVVATNLYHIAQEAVHNAVKHAVAAHITITLEQTDNQVLLTIADDGEGMPDHEGEFTGLGNRIMRYRAGIVGASLTVHSSERKGTTLTCVLPVSHVPAE